MKLKTLNNITKYTHKLTEDIGYICMQMKMKYLIVIVMLFSYAQSAQAENKSWALIVHGSAIGYADERKHFSKVGKYDYICLMGSLWYSNHPIFVRVLKPNGNGVSCDIIKTKSTSVLKQKITTLTAVPARSVD